MSIYDQFKEFLGYLGVEKNASKYTLENYTSDFKIFLNYLSSNCYTSELTEISTAIIRKYLVSLKNEGKYKNNSIRRKIHSLSCFFKYMLEQSYIGYNPMLPIHAPKKEQTLPVYLKEEELKRLIGMPFKYSRDNKLRDKTLLLCLAMTGIRRQELLSLNWQDIDLKNQTIRILHGKGNKQRLLPITEPLIETLWTYLQTRLPLNNEAVFISGKGNRLSTTAVQQLFTRYINLAKLNGKGYTIHKMRHSYASLLVEKNINLLALQELLGHSDLNSTKVYTHITANHLRKEVEKLPSFEI